MAYQFQGGSSNAGAVLRLGSAASTAPPITLSAWARILPEHLRDALGHTILCITDSGAGGDDYYTIRIQQNATLAVIRATAVSTGVGVNAETLSGIHDSKWHHVCAVFTSSLLQKIYLDYSITSSSTSNLPSGVNETAIGGRVRSNAATPIDENKGHEVREAAIWKAALTAPQVLSLASGASPFTIDPGNLVLYAPLARGPQNLRGAYLKSYGNVKFVPEPVKHIRRPPPANPSGNGNFAAQAATMAGSGISKSIGNGAFASGAATWTANAKAAHVGNGAFNSQSATWAGSGTSQSKGNGAFASQSATWAGSGTSKSSGSGAFASGTATWPGNGKSLSKGNGAFAAQLALSSGSGWLKEQFGNGNFGSASAAMSGVGTRSSAAEVVADLAFVYRDIQRIKARKP